MFEDIGHSNEARKKMGEYIIGKLKVCIGLLLMYTFSHKIVTGRVMVSLRLLRSGPRVRSSQREASTPSP